MGNILFHLQFPAPTLPAQINLDSFFESLDGWESFVSGSGNVLLDADKVTLSLGATLGSVASINQRFAYPRSPLTWAKNRQFKLKARLDVQSDAGSQLYICTGNEGANRRAFGFRFTNDKVRGFSKNGGAEQYIDLVTGLAAPYSRDEVYEAIFTAGSKIDFYIDGLLKGTLNTVLPTGTTDAERLAKISLFSSVSADHNIRTSMFRVIQDE